MQNFENKKKNGLEIWRKGTFPPNLALICMIGSEKMGFTDGRTDGRRTDGGTDDGRPRDDSRSAVQ